MQPADDMAVAGEAGADAGAGGKALRVQREPRALGSGDGLAMKQRRHVPHELDQGWVNAIKRLGDGTVSTKWGLYGELEVDIAAAAEVSPKTLVKSYTVQIIEGLGLKAEIVKKLQ